MRSWCPQSPGKTSAPWVGGTRPKPLYTYVMQLRIARLCLDCEEIHTARTCPRCTSESFALISRWVPAPERRARPRPDTTDADTYRALLEESAETAQPTHRWLKGGALLATIGLGGWLLRRRTRDQEHSSD